MIPGTLQGIKQFRREERLIWNVVLGIAYFVTGKFGLSLAYVNPSASAVWPTTGLAFTAILLLGRAIWPGVFVGAFLVNATTTGSVLSSMGIAFGNTAEAIIGAYLVEKFANGRNAFDRAQDVLKFFFLAAMLSTTVSATVGVISVSLAGFAPWSAYGSIWLTWWLGDALGDIVIAPFLILWIQNPKVHWNLDQLVELFFLIGFIVTVSQLSFGVWDLMVRRYPLSFLCVPPLVWTAFRFGPRETATTIVLLSAIAIKGTLEGIGPFVFGSPNESLLILQSFMGVNGTMVLALAAVVSERRHAEAELGRARDLLEVRVEQRTKELLTANKELQSEVRERMKAVDAIRQAEERFRNLVESAPDGIIIVNNGGIIQLINSGSEQMFGYDRKELVGSAVEKLLPLRFRGKHLGHRSEYFKSPQARPMGRSLELFALRKDGTEFPVEISLSPLMTADGLLVTAAIRDISERKELQHELTKVQEQRTRDLQTFAASVQQAQEVERQRIARELHDDLGQRLSGLKLNIQVLEGSLEPSGKKTHQKLKLMKDQIDSTIDEIRRISSNLRPSALDDFGLVVALRLLCREFERSSNLKTVFSADDAVPAHSNSEVEIALYRVVQEALTNVAKHANASSVEVRVRHGKNCIGLDIHDDGRGFDAEGVRSRRQHGKGIGLMSIRERTEHLGGTCTIESSPNTGTNIEVMIPLQQ